MTTKRSSVLITPGILRDRAKEFEGSDKANAVLRATACELRSAADRIEALELAGNAELKAAAEYAREVLRQLVTRENLAIVSSHAHIAIHQINAAFGIND